MRIAMVHSSFAVRGGAERYVRDLSAELIRRGHEVRVYARDSAHREPGDNTVGARLSARIPVARRVFTHLGDLLDPTGVAAGDLAGFAPQVVHVHNWQGLGVLPLARLARAYPTVHTVHDYAVCDPNNALAHRGRGGAVERLLGVRSAWIVRYLRDVTVLWPAERTRDLVLRHVPRASRLTGRVVPLAVPGESVTGPPGRPDTFLYLGMLSPHKGVDLLLAAWQRYRDRGGATLLLGGDGPLRTAVEAAARADASVRYLGYLDEAGRRAAFDAAGWLVFPSQWVENFPLSCVEALRRGRPIVSSALARPPMASDGSLLTFTDRDELVAALRRAATGGAERYDRMAACAAADGARLDWPAHVDAVLAAYEAGETVTSR